jgi:hypothetical protein
MEYLNNLFNSNTQSGGVYGVSMHQLNQILQLSSAYFNRFNDKTKQQYIKLFGFTPLSLLKGHSSSKMPQYRERFIFLIYLQFCVLLMMNNTAGMETKEEVLEYLSKLCKEFKISPDNKICKNINDALNGSTSTGSTSTGSTSTGSTSTGSTKDYTIDEAFNFIYNKLTSDDKKIVDDMLKEEAEAEAEKNEEQYVGDNIKDDDVNNLIKFITDTYPEQSENIIKIYKMSSELLMYHPVESIKFKIIFFTFIDLKNSSSKEEEEQLIKENIDKYIIKEEEEQLIKENIDKYIIKEEVLRIENDKIVVKLNDNLNVELLKKYLQKENANEEARLKAENDIEDDYFEADDNNIGPLKTRAANSDNNTSLRYSKISRESNINEEEKETVELHPDVKETVDLHPDVKNNLGLDGGSYNNIDITNTLQDIF